MRIERGARGAVMCFALAIASPSALAQYVSLVGGTPPVQDFNSLAANGTSAALPDGWYLFETDDNADSTYLADNGAGPSGNTYSYGATGNPERAFGMLFSGSLAPMIGAQLRNDTALALSEITVSYTGEQWRIGALGRADRIDAQYSLNATSLGDTNAAWVDVDVLDLAAPISAGTIGALDGNAAANRVAVNGSISGLNLAPAATLWLRWVDSNATGADDGLALDDISFAVAGDPPVDNPPAVSSTFPANQAIDVPLGATLAVTFNEAVTPTTPWFSLVCTSSGTHSASVSGGPASYTLTPSPAFAANESCTFTVLASGVVDNDGTPDHPLADHVVTFQTIDPTTSPPTVESIMPTDGATNVPAAADVSVIFSEAVTTTAGAFALVCDANPVSLIETGTGAQRTLTPDTLLTLGASCVFTISAGQVENAFGVHLPTDATSAFTVSTGSGGYYDQVNTESPEQLRCSLHQTIRGHTAYPYSGSGTSSWTILELAQANPANPSQILDVYKNRYYNAISDRAGTGSGITYNREHTWPNSLGFPSNTGNLGLPNAPYTDTHMLWLSDTQYNSDRGNKPFANCSVNCGERVTEVNAGTGGGSGVYPGNSNWVRTPDGNQGSFEVWGQRKGEMARAIFYMAIRYEGGVDPTSGQNEPELELTDTRSLIVGMNNYSQTAYMGLLADLLAWHQADPPDAAELARNEVVMSFQGNRNPFVDHPEWATRALFESSNPTVCELASNDSIFADGFEQAP
jgi:endonuclease I